MPTKPKPKKRGPKPKPASERAVVICVSLPPGVLALIDATADGLKLSRSEYLKQLAEAAQ